MSQFFWLSTIVLLLPIKRPNPRMLHRVFSKKKKIIIFHHSFWTASFSPLQFTLRGVGSPCIISCNIIDCGFPLYPHWVTKQRVCPPCFNPPFTLPLPTSRSRTCTRARALAYVYIYMGPALLTIATTVPSWQFSPTFYPLHTHETKKKNYFKLKKGCWTARLKSQVQYHLLVK